MNTPQSPEGGETQNPFDKAATVLAEVSFPETPEMADPETRAALIDAMASGEVDATRELLSAYQERAERVIDDLAPAEDITKAGNMARKKLQTRLQIATGLLWAEAGRTNKLGNALLDSHVMATNNHLEDDIIQPIRAALRLLLTPPDVQEIIEAFKAEFGAQAEAYRHLDSMETASPNGALGDVAEFMITEDTEEQPYDFFIRMGWAKS